MAKTEPGIIINGTLLSVGAAMTIRVALEQFAAALTEGGLGLDEHGLAMQRLYLEQINFIRNIIF